MSLWVIITVIYISGIIGFLLFESFLPIILMMKAGDWVDKTRSKRIIKAKKKKQLRIALEQEQERILEELEAEEDDPKAQSGTKMVVG